MGRTASGGPRLPYWRQSCAVGAAGMALQMQSAPMPTCHTPVCHLSACWTGHSTEPSGLGAGIYSRTLSQCCEEPRLPSCCQGENPNFTVRKPSRYHLHLRSCGEILSDYWHLHLTVLPCLPLLGQKKTEKYSPTAPFLKSLQLGLGCWPLGLSTNLAFAKEEKCHRSYKVAASVIVANCLWEGFC